MNTENNLIWEAYTENTLNESVKQAKQYVQQGKLSPKVLERLINIDPTKTKKYVGWMAKSWMFGSIQDIDVLRNTIEEFDTFVNRDRIQNKDINQYKTFKDLKDQVDQLNKTGANVSNKQLQSEYETLVDNEDLLVVVPLTHEASRKLGLTHFAMRGDDSEQDCAWCTTYKNPDHFNDYYFDKNLLFYYVKVKSDSLKKALANYNLSGSEYHMVALVVSHENKTVAAFDGLDNEMYSDDLHNWLDVTGLAFPDYKLVSTNDY